MAQEEIPKTMMAWRKVFPYTEAVGTPVPAALRLQVYDGTMLEIIGDFLLPS